ncbi:MAG: hypothetical protein QXS81_05565 [Candidatus Micrarchaeaceae archaeon]
MVGNAVPVKLAEAIAKKIMADISGIMFGGIVKEEKDLTREIQASG